MQSRQEKRRSDHLFPSHDMSDSDYYIKFNLKNKSNDFQWILVAVYGVAQLEFNEEFLT
ncbi:hypothetical protein ACP70R_032870 [Stipagrostis hirtigluma subsp. patula]